MSEASVVGASVMRTIQCRLCVFALLHCLHEYLSLDSWVAEYQNARRAGRVALWVLTLLPNPLHRTPNTNASQLIDPWQSLHDKLCAT